MKRIFGILALSITGSLFSQNGYPIFEDPINVTQYKLKNGLTVVLSESHDTPTIKGSVIVKTGGKNDPKDATGMAHYLEHMLFKGTQTLGTTDFQKEKIYLDKIDSLYEELGKTKDVEKRLDLQTQINAQSILAAQYAVPNEMDRMLSEIGGTNVNAFTSYDMTVYHNTFPSNKAEEWLSIYSHRFVNPVFRLFQSELETVYEEKNRGNESPFNYAMEIFLKNFFKNHPYGTQSIIGETEHLKNPSLLKMYEYFNTYYVANNMILCLVGDFNTEEIRPLIDSYFSNWRSGEVPTFPEYQEDDFQKGEAVTINATPIKLFARGYRTPKFGTYDALAMEIVTNLLSNSQRSGLFDEVVSHGHLMELQALPLALSDYGATIFLTIPKIIGQSFEKANAVLDEAIAKLISGDFSDELFEGARNEWILNFETALEGNEERAYMLASVYGNNMEWFEYVNYAKAIKEVTKPQLVEIAKKYFAQNYFTLYSKMGKIKPEKLSKPAFEPVIPNNETHSEFYEEWSKINSAIAPKEIISLKDSIRFEKLANGAEVKMVKNPINSIFNLEIVWEMGYRQNPELELLAQLLNSSTAAGLPLNEFKNELYALGTSIEWSVEEHQLFLRVSGLDENLEASLTWMQELLENPEITASQIKIIGKQVLASRKLESNEMQMKSSILREYILLKENSKYVKQPSYKDYKKVDLHKFNQLYSLLKEYKLHVNYVGNVDAAKLQNSLNKLELQNGAKTSAAYVYSFVKTPNEVYYLNDKKGVQSHITFVSAGDKFNKEDELKMQAFNFYFGSDMSSLLFQEIREFRSLAYGTYGFVKAGRNAKNDNILMTYVGCQGDKSPEALDLLHSLIKEMPIKSERALSVEKSVKNAIENSNPSFREYNKIYEQSLAKGYDDNFNLYLAEQLPALKFSDVMEYYSKNVQSLPLRLGVVGNKSKFDPTILTKYGKVIHVKLKKIYKL